MSIDIARRCANALKRLDARIDELGAIEVRVVRAVAAEAHNKLHERFNTAARSIGQSRRQRNAKGEST